MKYCCEAWTIEGGEDGGLHEMAASAEFSVTDRYPTIGQLIPTIREEAEKARQWCWQRMEEGYQTRMWRRHDKATG